MTNTQPDMTAVFTSLDEATAEFQQRVASFSEAALNTVPYEGSWTAAQVADHVTLSNTFMERSLLEAGQRADRQPDAGVSQLKKIFLDFNKKLQSPDFIVPAEKLYVKQELVAELQRSVDRVREAGTGADPAEMIRHAIFGEVTKLELLHFIIYHTQRHSHQLEKIKAALDK